MVVAAWGRVIICVCVWVVGWCRVIGLTLLSKTSFDVTLLEIISITGLVLLCFTKRNIFFLCRWLMKTSVEIYFIFNPLQFLNVFCVVTAVFIRLWI